MALTKMMSNFIKSESTPGILLLFAAILAVIINNSNYSNFYNGIFSFKIPVDLSFIAIYKNLTIKDWINDALMAIFFLFVGLELKREVITGELSTRSRIILPSAAACAGILVPALLYTYFNINNKVYMQGWAIPTATDIAFAIGVLNLFGNRVSTSLKVFLVALAVIDDLVAILIIAFFYSDNIDLYYIAMSCVVACILFTFNRLRIANLKYYLFFGVLLWVFVLKSGIHSTVAGVMLALFIPIIIKHNKKDKSPLHIMEHKLHNPVNYIILPIFAFANSGVSFAGMSIDVLTSPIVLGIFCGLFFGKQIGVFGVVYILDKLNICSLSKQTTWLEIYGVALLTGIGFTMSLFIGNLAFYDNPMLSNEIILGVLMASLCSGILGFLMIFWSLKKKEKKSKVNI